MSVRSYFALPASAVAAAILLAGAGGGAAGRAPDARQAGYLATWSDLSTWTRTDPATGRTETGLGLVLEGADGPIRLAFYVQPPPRGGPPATVGFRVAAGALMNPNVIRSPTVRFTAHGPDEEGSPAVIDLSSRMTVDNPAPGAAITSAVGTMPASSFQTLADAERLTGVMLGARVEVRRDQRAAIRAFRDRVF